MRAKTNAEATVYLKEKVANENKKDRQGDNRSKLYYVKAEYDATMLDDIFGPENWSVEILNQDSRVWEQQLISFSQNKREEYTARVASAWVSVRLTVTFPDGKKASRDGIGSGDAIRKRDNPNSVETEGLALKAAGTDALKRAATLLGNIFGRGMEKDGTQRYDYDYVPPEGDEADEEARPTTSVDLGASTAPQLQAQPQASIQPQRLSEPPQHREPVVTSGVTRPVQPQRQVDNRSDLSDDPFSATPSNSNGAEDDQDILTPELRRIIPQGRLIEVGAPDKWRSIFSQLNEARKNWVTTEAHVQIMKDQMAAFRKRAETENIISGTSAGAKDIKHFFDTMDNFVEKRRKEILGIPQAA
ncbi:hypothetical protein IC232_03920 [Microvirga sp. BT688]|uniref:Rad52/Rad22 family DNA repair protein n=1 Tax=Microvirga sp. TaxID=1873136 RepID=UPI001686A46D|nr:Rad52/Rad22 family DNA repair protein [Microvirga sp.]MBD2745839.1 hypothetical protein [Microvirga sp.]